MLTLIIIKTSTLLSLQHNSVQSKLTYKYAIFSNKNRIDQSKSLFREVLQHPQILITLRLVNSCRDYCLRESGRNFCPCKSLNQYCSSICHNGNSNICLNNRRAQESECNGTTVSVFVFHTILAFLARVAVCSYSLYFQTVYWTDYTVILIIDYILLHKLCYVLTAGLISVVYMFYDAFLCTLLSLSYNITCMYLSHISYLRLIVV